MTVRRLVNWVEIVRDNAAGAIRPSSQSSRLNLFLAEFRLALLVKGRDAFARILVHKKKRKAIDSVTHLVTAEAAVVERFGHLYRQSRLRRDLFRERDSVRKHAAVRHHAQHKAEAASFIRGDRIAKDAHFLGLGAAHNILQPDDRKT